MLFRKSACWVPKFRITTRFFLQSVLRLLQHLGTNSFYQKPLEVFINIQWFLSDVSSYLTSNQNRERSLHDFKPRLSSGFHSLIARDSRNESFSQLSDLFITSVFSRTQLIWKLIWSSSNPPVWKIPTISFQASQLLKCFRMALSVWVHPCCFVLLNKVFSVFPI